MTEFGTFFGCEDGFAEEAGGRPAAVPLLAADARSATFHPVRNSFSSWIHNVDCEWMVEQGNVYDTPALNIMFAMMFYE